MSVHRLKPLPRPPAVDWFRVLVCLDREGYSGRDVAALLDMSKGWIEHLRNSPGAEPRFADGMALLQFWCEAMDKTLHDVPRMRPGING